MFIHKEKDIVKASISTCLSTKKRTLLKLALAHVCPQRKGHCYSWHWHMFVHKEKDIVKAGISTCLSTKKRTLLKLALAHVCPQRKGHC